MDNIEKRGKFKSNFGFLMASIGSAVGLGNLWGFPYKMGKGGGFAFLLLYVVMVVCIGYCLMIGEFAIGRKSRKAPVGAYKAINKKFAFNGWFATLTPFFLLPFYTVLGGYCIKYLVANFGDILGVSWGVGERASEQFFGQFISNTTQSIVFTLLFMLMTFVIVTMGIGGGIEKFSVVAMPALFVMLIVVVIRSVTLPGASEGLAFMFKPNFEVFKGTGWISVLALAGGQLFFSLSLAAGCQIAYGSYLDDKENLERNALIVPVADMLAAILAGMATIPAVFASGLQPGQGPSMLFVTLQMVFKSMGAAGPWFATAFYLLVFLAALSSSIAMLEGGVASFIDMNIEKGKDPGRGKVTAIVCILTSLGGLLVAADGLGTGGLKHLFGFETWLETFDLFGEGLLMPLGGFFMAIFLGWCYPTYIDDEIQKGSSYKSKKFVHICLKYIAPVFMLFILLGQIDSFFKLGLF